MLTALIPTIASAVVSMSAGVAIDSVVKMIVPVGVKALPSFGIKMGTVVATTIVGHKLGKIIETNLKDVIDTVQSIDAQEVTAQEDN